MKHIICISGGLSSAWVANWAKQNLSENETVFYFNDTKWEHPDLYRFLKEISVKIGFTITEDSDGRTPEEIFRDKKFLGNNRTALCSVHLKAKRLQKYATTEDVVYFGIDCGPHELKRAARISMLYARLGIKTRFPIIETGTKRREMAAWLTDINVEMPELYQRGFEHNNCAGGCVRAGIKQWKKLYYEYPEIYAERERVEREFNERSKTHYTFLKNISLADLRKKITENAELPFDDATEWHGECVGICEVME